MKIEFNKKELLQLFICFSACAIINMLIHPAPDLYIIGDTTIIAIPYFIAVLYHLVKRYKKDHIIYLYTHRGFIIVMIILEILIVVSFYHEQAKLDVYRERLEQL